MVEKIGFFGGTFDPIHIGHLNLLIELKEKCYLDRVLVCPAQVSPTKRDNPPLVMAEHRLKMVELALSDLEGVEVSEIELSLPPPSYTIETINHFLKKEGKDKEVYLLMSEEAASMIDAWKEPEKLLTLASPLIGTRHGYDRSHFEALPTSIKVKLEKGRVQISAMDISSTNIRKRLQKGLYCGHLVPAKVLDYIYENRLYSSS